MNLDKSGNLVVRVPTRTTNEQIEEFVRDNQSWVNKQQNKFLKNPKDTKHVYFLGQKYLKEFKLHKLKNPKLKFEGGVFVFYRAGKISRIKQDKLLEKFYKKQGVKILPPMVEKYEQLIGKQHNKISIKRVKTRWGSCSSKGNLNFSFHLLKTPIECVEYVVAHEVCHLQHHNHSKDFWDLVESIYPDYKQYQKHLKQNQHLYT